MNRCIAALISIPALAVVLAACGEGDTINLPAPTAVEGITVSGTGEAFAPPDVATLTLGIEVSAPTVAEARERAADAADRLIAAANKANGVQDRDIQTTYIAVNPLYDYTPTGSPPRIAGYSVANILTVRVRDLDRVSAVIDDALGAAGDAARLNGIQFGIDNREALLREAREKAIADARARAETYAAAAGVRVGEVRAISEVSSPSVIVPRAPATGADARSTPIEPGEASLSVTVTVTFALAR